MLVVLFKSKEFFCGPVTWVSYAEYWEAWPT